MKITGFTPQIFTKDEKPILQLFEDLGFERQHTKEDIGELNVTGIQMKNADGFRVDLSQTDGLPVQSMTGIRMNVDDFDEAYRLLISHGFQNFYGDRTVETKSSRSAVMVSPSGTVINLVHHIKSK